MGEAHRRIAGRHYRRSHRLRSDQRGVVAVVGTLLAMLVFFALFGVFLEQYLPLWMIDNESQFTAETESSLATLKANVDLQAALDGPAVYATPFTMSSQGVPVLAQPTAAVLNFVPVNPGVFANVSMTPGPGGASTFFQNFTLGSLTVQLPNRYYSPQFFSFEDDAVVQQQSQSQQIVLYPPGLSVNVTGTSFGVTMTLFQLLGNATQTVSTGTQEVYTHFLFAQSFTSAPVGGTVAAKFILGTHYPCAWTRFLGTQFTPLGGHATLTPAACQTSLTASTLKVQFTGLASFTLVLAEYSIGVGVGVE